MGAAMRVGTARGSAILAARLKAYAPKPKANAFLRQVKALVAGKRKDATDITRDTVPQTVTTLACLTSSTAFATAASGTGLLDMDGDEALINSVLISQRITNNTVEDATPVGHTDTIIRNLIVYFKKPLLVASAAGTLPPITEVLVTDDVMSLPVPDTQNSGRFQIMCDRKYNMGINSVAVAATGTDPQLSGTTTRINQFMCKIDKKCHFKAAGVSGTPSGHYDSDVSPGQVDAGLLVMYVLIYQAPGSGTLNVETDTRLNYTG